MKICIIGGGWYGTHLALTLAKLNHEVVLIESNDICSNVSGKFGIRLHLGPHYPRSEKTRQNCQRNFEKFIKEYEELVIEHEYSIYALGKLDADNLPPKVGTETFKNVCNEKNLIDETLQPEKWGYSNLFYAANVDEPSIAVGTKLRETLKARLTESNVTLILHKRVTRVEELGNTINIFSDPDLIGTFDYVVNTTGYQSMDLIPKGIDLPFQVRYQTCVALVYKDTQPTEKPFSFIVLDGAFPCIMPYVEDGQNERSAADKKYILTHGTWTILGSFDNPEKGFRLLNELNANDIQFIRENCEKAIDTFWPSFKKRFVYDTYVGSVLAKLVTEVEFRSAVTFAQNKIVHVFPGKISNIYDVEEETHAIISAANDETLIHKTGFYYVKKGVMDEAMSEITQLPDKRDKRNTCALQTYRLFKPDFDKVVPDDAMPKSMQVPSDRISITNTPNTISSQTSDFFKLIVTKKPDENSSLSKNKKSLYFPIKIDRGLQKSASFSSFFNKFGRESLSKKQEKAKRQSYIEGCNLAISTPSNYIPPKS